MPKTDPELMSLLRWLRVPKAPAGLEARLTDAITRLPQRRKLSLIPVDLGDLGFNLRHDLRYQLAAVCMALSLSGTMSFGAYQMFHKEPESLLAAMGSEDAAALMEADPVISGGL